MMRLLICLTIIISLECTAEVFETARYSFGHLLENLASDADLDSEQFLESLCPPSASESIVKSRSSSVEDCNLHLNVGFNSRAYRELCSLGCLEELQDTLHDYIPFLGHYKEWWVTSFAWEYCSCGSLDGAVLKYTRDTLINGHMSQLYFSHELYGSYEICSDQQICLSDEFEYDEDWFFPSGNFPNLILNEDTTTGEVFIHLDGEDLLLYDFGAQVGDTLFIHDPEGYPLQRIVIDVDTTDIGDGISRKRIYLDGWENSQWIEGIGNIAFGPYAHQEGFGAGIGLQCYYEHGEALLGQGCGLILNLLEPAVTTTPSIYPNPFSEESNLDLGQTQGDVHLRIIDAFGRIVSDIWIPHGQVEYTLFRNGLSPGAYLLHIQDEVRTFSKRIVVQ